MASHGRLALHNTTVTKYQLRNLIRKIRKLKVRVADVLRSLGSSVPYWHLYARGTAIMALKENVCSRLPTHINRPDSDKRSRKVIGPGCNPRQKGLKLPLGSNMRWQTSGQHGMSPSQYPTWSKQGTKGQSVSRVLMLGMQHAIQLQDTVPDTLISLEDWVCPGRASTAAYRVRRSARRQKK